MPRTRGKLPRNKNCLRKSERKKKREKEASQPKNRRRPRQRTKRLTEEAKVNATRKAESDRALAAEKVAQAEAAHAETANEERPERPPKSQARQHAYNARKPKAIRTANAKLEALKTASHR